MRIPTSLIEARPGTYLLIGGIKAEQFEVSQVNVIGWASTAEGGFHPVTVAGVNHGLEQGLPVLHPDGRTEDPDGSLFATLDEWKRSAVKKARTSGLAAAA